jgi:hypothetical protein
MTARSGWQADLGACDRSIDFPMPQETHRGLLAESRATRRMLRCGRCGLFRAPAAIPPGKRRSLKMGGVIPVASYINETWHTAPRPGPFQAGVSKSGMRVMRQVDTERSRSRFCQCAQERVGAGEPKVAPVPILHEWLDTHNSRKYSVCASEMP